jgi:hypothetical protein
MVFGGVNSMPDIAYAHIWREKRAPDMGHPKLLPMRFLLRFTE